MATVHYQCIHYHTAVAGVLLPSERICRFPNEKMIIAHFITTRFETQYGGNWHCVVSDGRLGYEVRHHAEHHMFFSVATLTILLFREEDVKSATIESPRLKPRKLSTSMHQVSLEIFCSDRISFAAIFPPYHDLFLFHLCSYGF